MTVHIALLRAVNLAGNSSVAMADLRTLMAGLGFEAKTLLQSGNLVFDAGQQKGAALEALLEPPHHGHTAAHHRQDHEQRGCAAVRGRDETLNVPIDTAIKQIETLSNLYRFIIVDFGHFWKWMMC